MVQTLSYIQDKALSILGRLLTLAGGMSYSNITVGFLIEIFNKYSVIFVQQLQIMKTPLYYMLFSLLSIALFSCSNDESTIKPTDNVETELSNEEPTVDSSNVSNEEIQTTASLEVSTDDSSETVTVTTTTQIQSGNEDKSHVKTETSSSTTTSPSSSGSTSNESFGDKVGNTVDDASDEVKDAAGTVKDEAKQFGRNVRKTFKELGKDN